MPNKTPIHDLPKEFWTQSTEALGDEALQLIYAEVSARLRDENPEADTLELMFVERVAFLYVHIRNKETTKTFSNDRAHKETMQLWAQMAGELRKRRAHTADVRDVTERILLQVQKAVEVAMQTLNPLDARKFQDTLLTALDAEGL